MQIEKRKLIEEWFSKADHDIFSAEVIFAAQPIIFDSVAFHCQQAVEKYLKSYCIFLEILPPKSHNLQLLLNIILDYDTSFEELKFVNVLTPYAVAIRYADHANVFDSEVAASYITTAIKVKDFVRNKIGI